MDHNNESLQTETQDHPPNLSAEWTRFSIIDSKQSLDDLLSNSSYDSYYDEKLYLKPDSMVVMGDYLIILAFDEVDSEGVRNDRMRDIPTHNHLLAVDLRDSSFQKVQIDNKGGWSFLGEGSTLRKYNDNQIIAFSQDRWLAIITIKSFQPLSIKLKLVNTEKNIRCKNNIQIHNDGLYMFGTDSKNSPASLWRFDLKNETWKACKTVGQGPGHPIQARNFIFKDGFYAYDCHQENNIFKLNFNTMQWRKFEQENSFCGAGDVYNEHLVIFSEEEGLCCWNIQTNSWKIFNIKDPGFDKFFCNLVVYKNLLLILGESDREICLATYNLDPLCLEIPLSPEEQRLKALFTNEENSDVKFKIQGEIIPAHKEVLINKSRFFAGLFNSGMAETKQEVIEINDCDFTIFKEFLRHIYYGRSIIGDQLQAFKLFDFADKYLQEDLKEKCLDYLQSHINSKTVLPIFRAAYTKNLQDLMTSCAYYLKRDITLINISEIVQCLIPKQNDYPSFLRDEVFDWIIENYFEIYGKLYQSLRLCEEFLIKNIELETIVRISKFIEKYSKYAFFEQETKRLRDAIYSFIQENFQKLREEPIASQLTKKFLMDMMAYMLQVIENKSSFLKDNEEEKMKNGEAREGKRMEPIQKDNEPEEKPELKKTKK